MTNASVGNENIFDSEKTPTQILPQNKSPQTFSFKDALLQAIKNHSAIKIATNLVEQKRSQKHAAIGALLPKVRLHGSYKANIPEVEASLAVSDPTKANLYRQVAFLLDKEGNREEAENLRRQADLMQRRVPNKKIVINPKSLVEARLSIEIPLFNGPDIGRILASQSNLDLERAKLQEQQSNTIYQTAHAYYLAYYLKNILQLRLRAEKTANENLQHAKSQKSLGLISQADYLLAQANFFENKAEHQKAMTQFRSSIGHLGILMGVNEEFMIMEPDKFVFSALGNSSDVLINIALKNRPEIKVMQQAMGLAENNRLTNLFSFLPSLSLYGNADYTSNTEGLNDKSLRFTVGLDATISLFEGGTRFANYKTSSLKAQESRINLRRLEQDIKTKIRGHKENIRHLSLKYEAQKLKALAAQKAKEKGSDQYKRGLISLSDLLKVIEQKLAAEIQLKKFQADLTEEQIALTFEAGLLTPQLVY